MAWYVKQAVDQDLQWERNRREKAETTDIPESINNSINFLEQQFAWVQESIDQHLKSHPNLK